MFHNHYQAIAWLNDNLSSNKVHNNTANKFCEHEMDFIIVLIKLKVKALKWQNFVHAPIG